jgi:hypothetical protein
MKPLSLSLLFSILASLSCMAAGRDGAVIWTKIGPNLEVATDQVWNVKEIPSGRGGPRSFRFTALRFHLGYYALKLVDLGEFARVKADSIARDQAVDKTLPAFFELGVRSVFRINPFSEKVIAVAPAGFPTSSRTPTNLGLLKIEGVEKYKELNNGPSAVLCLDNPPETGFQYQIPTFFRTNTQSKLIDRCRDEVQTGPRILEDPSRSRLQQSSTETATAEVYNRKLNGKVGAVLTYLGIPDAPPNYVKYLRAAFAVDEPGRVSDENKERDVARNAYLVVTTSPAGFWDMQDMFKSPEFYANEQYAPRWAVNLPGDDYAALIHVKSWPVDGRDAVEVGAVALRQASVLVVVARK